MKEGVTLKDFLSRKEEESCSQVPISPGSGGARLGLLLSPLGQAG